MTNYKAIQQRYAMNLGTCMGIFWIVKFALIPLGLQYNYLFLAYTVLTLAVPFIGYRYVAAFRDKECGGIISFSQACLFCLSMYIFASLLASVAHYVYFAWIDNGYMVEKLTAMLKVAMEINPVTGSDRELIDEAMKEYAAMTPADFTLQYLSSDIFCCSFLSVLTALVAMRRKRKPAAEEGEAK